MRPLPADPSLPLAIETVMVVALVGSKVLYGRFM